MKHLSGIAAVLAGVYLLFGMSVAVSAVVETWAPLFGLLALLAGLLCLGVGGVLQNKREARLQRTNRREGSQC